MHHTSLHVHDYYCFALLACIALEAKCSVTAFCYQQVGPKDPTAIPDTLLAAPATMETELVKNQAAVSSTFRVFDAHASSSKGFDSMPVSAANSPAVAVDMDSPDVRAERERVAALSSFENQCIVIKDLRKVYPPQVGLRLCTSVPATVAACRGVLMPPQQQIFIKEQVSGFFSWLCVLLCLRLCFLCRGVVLQQQLCVCLRACVSGE